MANEYNVYLTEYSGDLLPHLYIGSSTQTKIDNGYNGSVTSTKYKDIFRQERKNNPQKFKTQILKTFNDRAEALRFELELQIINDVVKSPHFINMSLASVNGCFGMDVSGKLNPMYGRKHPNHVAGFKGLTHTDESKSKISIGGKGLKRTEETKSNISKGKTNPTKEVRENYRNANLGEKNHRYGTITSDETKRKQKESHKNRKSVVCPHCDKEGKINVMVQWHFDKCKYKENKNG